MAVARNVDTDWRDNKNLPECMLYMLKNEIMCDVTFQVGEENKSIRAHKYMLSSRSPVFHTMFEGSLPEKGVISIPDIDESTFHSLLQYIYCDELSISNENVKEMLYVSEKYMITKVKKECEKVLQISALTCDAAISLQAAYDYKLDSLLNQSINFIENNTIQCFQSDYALNLSKECLELILKSESLNCTETELCSFFLKWTRNQCDVAKVEANGENLRSMAGHLLFLVRFPLVDPKIFTKDLSVIGLLTQNETISIYQCYFGVTVENFPFSNIERNPLSKRGILPVPLAESKMLTVTRFLNETCDWQSNCAQALTFETNKDVWLKGVAIRSRFNPENGQNNYYTDDYGFIEEINNIYFKVISADEELYSYFCENIATRYTDQAGLIEVIFPDPVQILKYTQYTIIMEGVEGPSVSVSNVTLMF